MSKAERVCRIIANGILAVLFALYFAFVLSLVISSPFIPYGWGG